MPDIDPNVVFSTMLGGAAVWGSIRADLAWLKRGFFNLTKRVEELEKKASIECCRRDAQACDASV